MCVCSQGMWFETTACTRTAAATLTKNSAPHTDDILFLMFPPSLLNFAKCISTFYFLCGQTEKRKLAADLLLFFGERAFITEM